jgi:hypothetical protein
MRNEPQTARRPHIQPQKKPMLYQEIRGRGYLEKQVPQWIARTGKTAENIEKPQPQGEKPSTDRDRGRELETETGNRDREKGYQWPKVLCIPCTHTPRCLYFQR